MRYRKVKYYKVLRDEKGKFKKWIVKTKKVRINKKCFNWFDTFKKNVNDG